MKRLIPLLFGIILLGCGCTPRVNFLGDKPTEMTVGGRIIDVSQTRDDDETYYQVVQFLHDDGVMNSFALCGTVAPLQKHMHVAMVLWGEQGKGCYEARKILLIDQYDFNQPAK